MLVKYYLSDNIKAPFEDFALGLRNAWASPASNNLPLRICCKNVVDISFLFWKRLTRIFVTGCLRVMFGVNPKPTRSCRVARQQTRHQP